MSASSAAVETWRVLPYEVSDPRTLVDGSLAVLAALADDPRPTLRWYTATGTAIVLGRGQAASLTARSTSEVSVLTRHSGGGAVLLDPSMLSLDVAVPAGHPLLGDDLAAVFLAVGRAWAAALESLGVRDLTVYSGANTARRRGSPREQLLAAVCFATPGRGEVLWQGRKLVGLAQRRRRQGALVQCGLLRRWRPAPLLRALGADPDDAEIAGAAVGLDDLTGIHIPVSDIREAVEQQLQGATSSKRRSCAHTPVTLRGAPTEAQG